MGTISRMLFGSESYALMEHYLNFNAQQQQEDALDITLSERAQEFYLPAFGEFNSQAPTLGLAVQASSLMMDIVPAIKEVSWPELTSNYHYCLSDESEGLEYAFWERYVHEANTQDHSATSSLTVTLTPSSSYTITLDYDQELERTPKLNVGAPKTVLQGNWCFNSKERAHNLEHLVSQSLGCELYGPLHGQYQLFKGQSRASRADCPFVPVALPKPVALLQAPVSALWGSYHAFKLLAYLGRFLSTSDTIFKDVLLADTLGELLIISKSGQLAVCSLYSAQGNSLADKEQLLAQIKTLVAQKEYLQSYLEQTLGTVVSLSGVLVFEQCPLVELLEQLDKSHEQEDNKTPELVVCRALEQALAQLDDQQIVLTQVEQATLAEFQQALKDYPVYHTTITLASPELKVAAPKLSLGSDKERPSARSAFLQRLRSKVKTPTSDKENSSSKATGPYVLASWGQEHQTVRASKEHEQLRLAIAQTYNSYDQLSSQESQSVTSPALNSNCYVLVPPFTCDFTLIDQALDDSDEQHLFKMLAITEPATTKVQRLITAIAALKHDSKPSGPQIKVVMPLSCYEQLAFDEGRNQLRLKYCKVLQDVNEQAQAFSHSYREAQQQSLELLTQAQEFVLSLSPHELVLQAHSQVHMLEQQERHNRSVAHCCAQRLLSLGVDKVASILLKANLARALVQQERFKQECTIDERLLLAYEQVPERNYSQDQWEQSSSFVSNDILNYKNLYESDSKLFSQLSYQELYEAECLYLKQQSTYQKSIAAAQQNQAHIELKQRQP